MMRVLNSLVVRLGLIFLAGLVLLQAAIFTVMLWPNGQPAAFRLVSPEEAVAMARALEAVDSDQRPLVIAALNGRRQIVGLLPDFPPDPPSSSRLSTRAVDRAFAGYGAPLEDRAYRIQTRRGRAWSAILRGDVGAPGSIRLLVQLRTGEVLSIERAPVVLQMLISRWSLIAGAGTLILILVMGLCLLQMARPINRLASGALEIADDVRAGDLRISGPREIRDLARALNNMKHRIGRLLDDRTRVLAAIAHDLRTYLTRLRLRTEFIEDEGERRAAIADLEEMNLLLDDTLMFSRETRAERPQDLRRVDLLAEAIEFTETRREMGQPVEWRSDQQDGVNIQGSPLAIRRILGNLVDNALRYGGSARIIVGVEDAEATLVVEDEGPGAPPETLETLVEPFERLESSRGRHSGGAGLGLAIVKALAESQGGRFSLENGARRGLRAIVRLPLAS